MSPHIVPGQLSGSWPAKFEETLRFSWQGPLLMSPQIVPGQLSGSRPARIMETFRFSWKGTIVQSKCLLSLSLPSSMVAGQLKLWRHLDSVDKGKSSQKVKLSNGGANKHLSPGPGDAYTWQWLMQCNA